MSKLRLSVAIGDYDRTRALIDGTVGIDGVDPVVMPLGPEEIFFRALRNEEFDICELSLSSFTVRTARGDCPYVGVPAFLSRAFRHTSIYVRTDRVSTPEDLKGKRMGLPEYQLTANVWARALLEDDYGVKPADMVWVRAGIEEPGRIEKIAVDLPKNVRLEDAPAEATLAGLLAAGEIDAMMGPRAPSCYREKHPHVGRLFPDSEAAARDYYDRTGIFPIMHLIGVRRSLAEAHPWLPAAVLKALIGAKRIGLEKLEDLSASKVMLPFAAEQLERTQAQMGRDFWTYGARQNAVTLNAFLRHHHAQGLSQRKLKIEDLFHPATLEEFKI
ncbi:MAG: ABC transporter substrate-binding protein [Hyphomicrobiales bacterium]|nr:ABC transporter substrate-binding protein [Hyphomicrobiales bacterium]